MFTGIVEGIGKVQGIARSKTGICLSVNARKIASGARIGDSVAINGACLSITAIKNDILSFDVITETLNRTTIGELKINDSVNLERSLKADSRIDGHFVSGHIDYKGRIVELLKGRDGTGFRISVPDEFARFVVEKGSVAIDGVSLTVADSAKGSFTVYLIPHTLKATTFSNKKRGDLVNVETDLLAKYILKQSKKPDLATLLKKYSYI
ncbi:MAG: riboflavin synthase [Candidatus Omnitrophica bacterium]|nr:riboflavin synthase [Candidatus Omnitrophota bacterium]MBU1932349.1 riboflavin synthase [Candidatus Omnitrophota bacterium]